MPSIFAAARLAWADLLAAVPALWPLAAIAVAVCTAATLFNALVNQEDYSLPAAMLLTFGNETAEILLITPVLIGTHRFIILGETSPAYATAWRTDRFWRFAGLTMSLVGLLFISLIIPSLLLTRVQPAPIALLAFVPVVSVVGVFVAMLWLSLMFPAIAVDAPHARIDNAIADIRGNVWRIFFVATIASLPLIATSLVQVAVESALVHLGGLSPVQVKASLSLWDGTMAAASYLLAVVIASRFFLWTGRRLQGRG